ncbi:hypothetical protein P389DRAFT_90258 [Cystobasidium minutum MCA 4210]|uniref:uncharacterized protein n=1 Tax=Cystobasidium minutum MCA 4210 TaxID=1397322 RepID=UPI0034CE266E|eukprot:jgi/Rhomi1/90258/CE90257_1625
MRTEREEYKIRHSILFLFFLLFFLIIHITTATLLYLTSYNFTTTLTMADDLPTKKDGSLDMRYKSAREAAEGDDTAGEGQGQPGGPDSDDKNTNEDGVPLRKDGQPDKRFSSEHGFGGDRERASEEGKKGGSKNSTDGDDE